MNPRSDLPQEMIRDDSRVARVLGRQYQGHCEVQHRPRRGDPDMSRDWTRFGQEGIEHGFDRFTCLLQYRVPQDLVDFPK